MAYTLDAGNYRGPILMRHADMHIAVFEKLLGLYHWLLSLPAHLSEELSGHFSDTASASVSGIIIYCQKDLFYLSVRVLCLCRYVFEKTDCNNLSSDM